MSERRMRNKVWRVVPALAVVAAAAMIPAGNVGAAAKKIGMVCTNGPNFNLTAKGGYIETPDGNSIYMWSYANTDTGANFQSPGPVLCVTQGQTVNVTLTNTLPEPVSITFPGQTGVTATGNSAGTFTQEAAATTGTATYSFVAGKPGTYAYESGSDPAKQLEMGLYGALIVRPSAGDNYAYDTNTQFDPSREYLLVLNEIDPDLHHAVETQQAYDPDLLHNRYFAINGREFPDTIQDNGVSWLPGQPYGSLIRVQPYNATSNPQPALIRMVNVGELNHPFHPHGNHIRQIAQDGRPIDTTGGDFSSEHFGDTIGSGQTQDFLFKWTDTDSWDKNSNPFPSDAMPPSYLNLTYKDNNTWFSGSPYLGLKGTLPTVVNSQNVCGEWYFPWHSHALNEFANFDEGFGGMATLLRVDPPGGCSAFPTSTKILAGTLSSGSYSNLAKADTSYYAVNSASGSAAWYGGFTGVAAAAQNMKVTYTGKNTAVRSQTVKICDWTVAGVNGCSTPSSGGWTTLPAGGTGPAQPQSVGTSDVASTWSLPTGSASKYVGTGSYSGQVRVMVQTTGGGTFTTSGNFLKIQYDAP